MFKRLLAVSSFLRARRPSSFYSRADAIQARDGAAFVVQAVTPCLAAASR
ncbi:hypothetical protein L6Q96_16870 [Candidatus Binatia bacterium]|nr:hypothetical protein [Candidatus Binatia bacterium]